MNDGANAGIIAKKKIGIVGGGTLAEREYSTRYANKMKKVFESVGMDVTDFHLHPNGSWTVDGVVKNIEDSIKKVDKVWNCLVGSDGENGVVEDVCQKNNVQMIGHKPLHVHLSRDKKNFSVSLAQHKIKTSSGRVIKSHDWSDETVKAAFGAVGLPAIVKPNEGSGARKIFLVESFPDMHEKSAYIAQNNHDVLVENLIKGIPVSCFIFSYENSFHANITTQDAEYILSKNEIALIRDTALFIHNAYGFSHHVEYDFILKNTGGRHELFFLEANTHPDLTGGYIKKSFKNVSLDNYVLDRVS